MVANLYNPGGGGSAPPQVTLASPSNGAAGQPLTPTLTWNASTGATGYNVYLGTSNPPGLAMSGIPSTSYAPPTLAAATTYYWSVVATNDIGSSPVSAVWSFTTYSGGASPWQTSGPNIFFSGGNVGIGTANPLTPLHVVGAASATTFSGNHTGSIAGITIGGATGNGNVVFSASPTFTGVVTAPAITGTLAGNATNVTGVVAVANGGTGQTQLGSSGQCLQSSGSGMVWGACGGSGGVTSVTAGAGLSGGTITTSGTLSLNLGNPNSWTGAQTFSNATFTAATNFPGGIWNASGSVGIGTTSPQSKLAVNGTITAKEVTVTNTGWADYVFRPGYRLRPLADVKTYIQSHRHLPDVPSEADVKASGVSLGEMQAKLLAKIEELTLHLIAADEQVRRLNERITQLEAAGKR